MLYNELSKIILINSFEKHLALKLQKIIGSMYYKQSNNCNFTKLILIYVEDLKNASVCTSMKTTDQKLKYIIDRYVYPLNLLIRKLYLTPMHDKCLRMHK